MIITFPISHVAQAQTPPSVTFSPSTVAATQVNQTFTLNIDISNVQSLWGWIINVTFDSAYLKFQSSSEGSFLTSQGATTLYIATKPIAYKDPYSNIETMDSITLQDAIDSSANGEDQSVSGSGTLVTLTFQAVNQTSSTLVTLGVEQLEGPNPTSATTGAPRPIITPASYTSAATVSLIIPGPPTANAGQEQSVTVGTQVIFNGSQSVSSGSNATYTWTFTDDTLKTLTGIVANYTFNNPGNYTVTLTVTDSLGTSNSITLIHVIGVAAIATPTATTTPTQTSTSALTTPTPTSTSTPTPTLTQTTDSFSLPPAAIAILVFVTICVFTGSFFWLKKQT